MSGEKNVYLLYKYAIFNFILNDNEIFTLRFPPTRKP